MKKKIITISFALLVSCFCFCQNINMSYDSLSVKIRENFEYDSLPSISCINTPSGLYYFLIKFNKRNSNFSCEPMNPSVPYLNRLIVNSITKSLNNSKNVFFKSRDYIQPVYIKGIIDCNPLRDSNNVLISNDTIKMKTIDFSSNIDKAVIDLLSLQLENIHKSIEYTSSVDLLNKQLFYLPVTIIDHHNPKKIRSIPIDMHVDKKNMSLQNQPYNLKDRVEKTIKEVQKKKDN